MQENANSQFKYKDFKEVPLNIPVYKNNRSK